MTTPLPKSRWRAGTAKSPSPLLGGGIPSSLRGNNPREAHSQRLSHFTWSRGTFMMTTSLPKSFGFAFQATHPGTFTVFVFLFVC